MIKNLQPGLSVIGRIKIGEPGEEIERGGRKFRPPRKLDYFKLVLNTKDAAGRYIVDKAMHERLGERPTQLKVRLLFDNIDMNLRTSLSYYRGGGGGRGGVCFCRGDGEIAQRRAILGKKDGYEQLGPYEPYAPERSPCGEACQDFIAKRCRPFGALSLVLDAQQQIGGIWLLTTTSWFSIRNLLASQVAIRAQTGGLLSWLPLTLKLVPQQVSPKDGSPPSTVYVLQMLYDGTPQQLLLDAKEILSTRAPLLREVRQLEREIRALPPADLDDEEEAQDIVNEFYPQNREEAPPLPPLTPEPAPASAPAESVTVEGLEAEGEGEPEATPTPPAASSVAAATPVGVAEGGDDAEAFRLF